LKKKIDAGGKMSFVYILTNEAMPGYIKIGRTDTSVEQRMRELDRTSVPLPFQCYYAARVEDHVKLERTLHTAFGDHRVRSNREFFQLDPYRAKVIIELLAIEDVTPGADLFEDQESAEAVEKATRRTGQYNFGKYGIPVGAVLEYVRDRSITATVHDERLMEFQGELVSPSKAAAMANRLRGGTGTAFPGPLLWLYEGETLSEIRRAYMAEEVEDAE
jgi:hypothetical protein